MKSKQKNREDIETMKNIIFVILAITILCTSCRVFQAQGAIITENESNISVPENNPTPKQTPITSTITREKPPTPQPKITERVQTPEPTIIEFVINPIFKLGEDGINYVFFSNEYSELYRSTYEFKMIVPEYIVIHTDGQSDYDPSKWSTLRTYWGLGTAKSVHFAVSSEEVLQMLPMEETTVNKANGTSAFWDTNNKWVDYDETSIQIEMGGKNYNYFITGEASPEMTEAIKDTTEKTIDLVISLMVFYKIPLENVLGHYQFGPGKVDPGNLYFEEYFIPLLEQKYENFKR